MNQQFRRVFELAKQADLIQWDTLPSGAKTPDHESVAKAQKFAELIVRECANAIQTEKDTGLYNAQQMAGMTVSKTVVKDHFGVEE